MQFLKKFKIEIGLVLILIVCAAVFFNLYQKNQGGKEENANGKVDGLYSVETYAEEKGDTPSDSFYEHWGPITDTDFKRFQIKNMGETVKYVLPWWQSFESYVEGDLEPTMKLTVTRVVKSDQYKGNSENGYHFLTFYFTAENDYKLGYVWEITGNYGIQKYADVESYLQLKKLEKEERIDDKDTNWSDCNIEIDQDTKGVVYIGKDGVEYQFSEPGDKNCIYMESGAIITGAITMKLQKEKIDDKRNIFVLDVDTSQRRENAEFAIVITPDEIEEVENID